jgi:hypothetical protein
VRYVLSLAAVVLVSVIAAGCGGSDSDDQDPTAAWASGFCTAITDWTDELQSITSQFTDTSNLNEDAIRTAASDAKSSTDQLVDDIRGLGRPDTSSGQEVEDSIDQLSTTLEDESTKIDDTAQGISGLTELPGAITTISTSLTTMSTAFSNTLTTIENADVDGELKAALEASPECDEITGSSG